MVRTCLYLQQNAGPDTTDAWYFAAVSFDNGQTMWKRLAGTGELYNNSYSGIAASPDGKSIYTGALGGVVGITDTNR